jgi:hypothetical protein
MAPQVQLRSCESRPFRRFGESVRHMPAIPDIGRPQPASTSDCCREVQKSTILPHFRVFARFSALADFLGRADDSGDRNDVP